jgi:hypothetical protein
MEHELYKDTGDFNVYTKSELLEVKVPSFFSGTQGFPARRDRRYSSFVSNVIKAALHLEQIPFCSSGK